MINIENMKKWTTALREPGRTQVQRTLSRADWTGDCCLGLGCKVAAVPYVENPIEGILAYGSARSTGLPPEEFHLWLGTIEEPGQEDEEGVLLVNPNDGEDVMLDIPVSWLLDREGGRIYRWAGCANLNDTLGLTFPQIADMIDYFGIKPLY